MGTGMGWNEMKMALDGNEMTIDGKESLAPHPKNQQIFEFPVLPDTRHRECVTARDKR